MVFSLILYYIYILLMKEILFPKGNLKIILYNLSLSSLSDSPLSSCKKSTPSTWPGWCSGYLGIGCRNPCLPEFFGSGTSIVTQLGLCFFFFRKKLKINFFFLLDIIYITYFLSLYTYISLHKKCSDWKKEKKRIKKYKANTYYLSKIIFRKIKETWSNVMGKLNGHSSPSNKLINKKILKVMSY